MKKQTKRKLSQDKDTMRPEYNFSKGVRGKHAARYAEGTNVVVLEPDVAREFRTTEQINDTLRAVSNCFNNTGNAPAARRHNTAMNPPPLAAAAAACNGFRSQIMLA
jgi:hypothetical protein